MVWLAVMLLALTGCAHLERSDARLKAEGDARQRWCTSHGGYLVNQELGAEGNNGTGSMSLKQFAWWCCALPLGARDECHEVPTNPDEISL